MLRGIIVGLLLFLSGPAFGVERITRFDSAVQINTDGTIDVTETIAVVAEGNQIRRGIYRDFPTIRGRTWWGNFRVTFDVVNVSRNGQSETWHTERISGGTRLYLGRSDTQIPRGAHTYVVHYRTDRQIGFFDDHDELYWNVTGNFWAFPIEHASAEITLPPGAQIGDVKAYTGPVNSTQTDAQIETHEGVSKITALRTLNSGEGLTAVAAWPKGVVHPPSLMRRTGNLFHDNAGVIAGFLGLLCVAVFYGLSWWNYGKDPEKGTIIAHYDPPKGLSPSACRYIEQMGWDEKVFTVAVVNLAAKGFITLQKATDDAIILMKTKLSDARSALSKGELAILHKLFSGDWSSLPLRKEHSGTVREAIADLKGTFEAEHDHVHFLTNRGLVATGWGLSLLTLAALTIFSRDRIQEIVVGVLTGGIVFLIYGLMRRRSFGSPFKMQSGIAGVGLLILLRLGLKVGIRTIFTVIGSIIALPTVAEILNVALGLGSVLALAVIVINIFFLEAMRAPTHLGQKVVDHIEGFRHYLTVAEKDRLNFHNPPDLTPQRFEAYLPYAIALGVENAWGEQFTAAMHRVAAAGGPVWNEEDYAPRWYSDGWNGKNFDAAISNLTSTVTGAINTAVAAPSEKSGSGLGGGGFSGGGGGGGGGW
jgi:hypothetical protein